MSISSDPALVITDGGLAGLLACFIEGVCRPAAKVDSSASSQTARSTSWFGLVSDQIGQRDPRRLAARRAAQLAHLGELVEWSSPAGATALDARSRGEERSKLLLAAGAEALRRGLSRVVWPIQLGGPGGPDADRHEPSSAWLDSIADACDRAIVCARLLSLDAEGEGLTIQTPFVDFTDAQLADLAGDVDLPVEAAFYGSIDADRERWRKALAFAGLPMPAVDAHGISPTVRASASESRAASV